MKTFILSIILCSITSLSYATWKTYEEETKNFNKEEKLENWEEGKFFLATDHKGKGISLVGARFAEDSIVCIRKVNNKYDFCLTVDQSLWKESGEIYLRLLDQEGFQVCDFSMGKVGQNYKGSLYHTENINWVSFYDVYTYEIHMRG